MLYYSTLAVPLQLWPHCNLYFTAAFQTIRLPSSKSRLVCNLHLGRITSDKFQKFRKKIVAELPMDEHEDLPFIVSSLPKVGFSVFSFSTVILSDSWLPVILWKLYDFMSCLCPMFSRKMKNICIDDFFCDLGCQCYNIRGEHCRERYCLSCFDISFAFLCMLQLLLSVEKELSTSGWRLCFLQR